MKKSRLLVIQILPQPLLHKRNPLAFPLCVISNLVAVDFAQPEIAAIAGAPKYCPLTLEPGHIAHDSVSRMPVFFSTSSNSHRMRFSV